MKKKLKKLIIAPIYGLYYVLFELIMGVGMKEPWDKLVKWTDK